MADRITSRDGASVIHFPEIQRLDDALVALARETETAAICDVCSEAKALDPGIQSMSPGHRLAGQILTVRLPPAENLMLHVAIRLLQPGFVLVVTTTDPTRPFGPFGDLMRTSAQQMGGSGMVLDGFIRDKTTFTDGAFPVFARGVTPKACQKEGGGEINGLLMVGDAEVYPGDLIVADDNGIVVVPMSVAGKAISDAREKMAHEDQRKIAIQAWDISPGYLDASLRNLGMEALFNRQEWNLMKGTGR